MPRTRTQRPANPNAQPIQQLSFWDDLLSEREGELIKLPLDPASIGGSLLEILSNGLYTNPLACIREYVQNSVDAHASSVTLHITGNSVNIVDDGDGMSLAEMLRAREFGLSPKFIEQHVGFRGIGIYSGYDICRKMRITSKKAGETLQHVLVFDFEAMRSMLEADRKRRQQIAVHQEEDADASNYTAEVHERVSLISLLSEHTYIKREQSDTAVDLHMTHVQLMDISEAYIKQLSNLGDLKKYMLQNLPIDFADFKYRETINQHLHTNVPGYNAVSIRIQSDGVGEELIQRRLPDNLQEPTFEFLTSADGRQVAYYWACLTSEPGRLEPTSAGNGKSATSNETATYEGFVYKMKGFTIGDRNKLRSLWRSKETLYRWYTGEIYVLDPNVKPNAERDDFETSPSQRALVWAVTQKLDTLYQAAENYQAQSVADERIAKYSQDIAIMERRLDTNALQPGAEFELYTRLTNMLDDMKRQRRKASHSNQQLADELKKRIERVQRQLQKSEDPRTTEVTKRKRAAQNTLPLETDSGPETEPHPSIVIPEPLPPAPDLRLLDILQLAGWDIEGKLLTLVNVLQASFEDVLILSSPAYRHLLTDIESRLTASVGDQ